MRAILLFAMNNELQLSAIHFRVQMVSLHGMCVTMRFRPQIELISVIIGVNTISEGKAQANIWLVSFDSTITIPAVPMSTSILQVLLFVSVYWCICFISLLLGVFVFACGRSSIYCHKLTLRFSISILSDKLKLTRH